MKKFRLARSVQFNVFYPGFFINFLIDEFETFQMPMTEDLFIRIRNECNSFAQSKNFGPWDVVDVAFFVQNITDKKINEKV